MSKMSNENLKKRSKHIEIQMLIAGEKSYFKTRIIKGWHITTFYFAWNSQLTLEENELRIAAEIAAFEEGSHPRG